MVLVAMLPAVALAQAGSPQPASPQPASPVDERSVPELNGHVFMPSQVVDSPFRSTTFKLGILYAFGTATGQKYTINGPVPGVTVDYTFASFAQVFRYEYRFAEWFSASGFAVTSLYSGIDGPSVIAVGTQVGAGAGARLKAGHRFGPVDIALVGDVSYTPEYGILVAAAIIEAVRQGAIAPGSALQAKHSLGVVPELAASWAPWSALGLTANVGYAYKSLRTSSSTISSQNGFEIGGRADFDFGKISAVALGLNLGYKLLTPVGSGGISKVQDISGGIFYTGVREVGLGLEFGSRSFTIRQPLASTETVVQLQLQYYW